eukprot:c6536_g1_i1.p1 GENE.c6536_g1_i1~~c6536_g1_i1.p1  ORF type:complete len:269 (-),score=66.13 c6536_g1_i1:41-847(-)
MHAALCVASLLVCAAFALPEQDITSFVQTEVTTSSGVNVSSIAINAGGQRESKLTLGDADEAFTLVMQPDGSFAVRHRNTPTFVIDPAGPVSVAGTLRSKGAMRIDGTINFMGVQQWFLAAIENFNEGATGWTNSSTTTCGNTEKKILGGCGKFAGGEVSKTFFNLPAHDWVRVTANFHFIDKWGGETAYAKLQDSFVWTDTFDQVSTKVGIDLCCSPAPESKFSTPIDVSLPHTDGSLKLTFGSTLTLSPMEQSWGVSDVQVYVRKV